MPPWMMLMMMMKITNAVVELMCLAGGAARTKKKQEARKGAEVEVHSGLFSILFFVDCCADQQQIDLCLRYVPRHPVALLLVVTSQEGN